MGVTAWTRKRRNFILSFVLVALAFIVVTAEKIVEYAAPPAREKDCDFLFPPAPGELKATTIVITPERLPVRFRQQGGYINDASCLNKTAIYGIVQVVSEDDVRNALRFARDRNLKVTTAGQRHSMGGQSFVHDGVVLDMRDFNAIRLDRERRIVNVQSGARWWRVQQFLDKQGLSVKAMQSINIFSVGGTLSVNAHGIAHNPGQVAPTVKAMRIMLADGEVKTASPTENPELFRNTLGGYGLFGVILDADLEVVPNEMYERHTEYMSYRDFPAFYQKNVAADDNVGLVYGRLSMSPDTYLDETALHIYRKSKFEGDLPALKLVSHDLIDRFVINFSKTGPFGRRVRWTLEKRVEPLLHGCLSRNQAMGAKELCLVSRNQEMYDSMAYLKNRLADTDILQEYFIPPDRIPQFVDGLREVVRRNHANLLNVTIRIVHKDDITALAYARQDSFGFVLYFNQRFNDAESKILQQTTTELVDLALSCGGTFYLPYQLFYSPQQLRQSYPGIGEFFAAKRKWDPEERFSNKFYEKYGKATGL